MNSPNFSIRFGETVDRGMEEQTVFPFMYTMIPFDRDQWDLVKANSPLSNLSDIGPQVPPSSNVQHAVVLDPDYMFKLLWIKYTVYAYYPGNAVPGRYIWYGLGQPPVLQVFDYQTSYGTQLLRDLRVTISFYGSQGNILYGGKNLDAASNLQGDRLPLPIDSVQGYDYGIGQIKSPYLLPRQSTIMFEITNTNTAFTFVVGALIYGMKVRL